MAILLHNLWARSPKMSDLEAVTELLVASDIFEDSMSDYSQEDLHADWQKVGFDLEHDAWVIATNQGQFVGYASVWSDEDGHLDMRLCVHPEYRNRGIGTLLLRLAEHRARHHVHRFRGGMRVVLSSAVSNANQGALQLLEQEGYTAMRHFWRLMIDMDESFDEFYQRGTLKFDVVMNAQGLMSVGQMQKRTGMYVARQYDIYEKELRAGKELGADQELCTQSA